MHTGKGKGEHQCIFDAVCVVDRRTIQVEMAIGEASIADESAKLQIVFTDERDAIAPLCICFYAVSDVCTFVQADFAPAMGIRLSGTAMHSNRKKNRMSGRVAGKRSHVGENHQHIGCATDEFDAERLFGYAKVSFHIV